MNPRLKEKYKQTIVPALMKQFAYKNALQVPRLEKIVLNSGVGEASQNIKILDLVVHDITTITGQKPLVTRAKKSIAAFKIREGMPIGCKATLRGNKMYEFLDRLVNAALPRTKDFKGVSPKSFDEGANFSLGIKEYNIFPEIVQDKVEKVHGLDITFVTSAKKKEEARALLQEFGMPFKD